MEQAMESFLNPTKSIVIIVNRAGSFKGGLLLALSLECIIIKKWFIAYL